MKILIVEDDPTARYALHRAIRNDARTVLEAEHGGQAIEKIHENQPDLVFLDLNMPVQDGLGVLDALRDSPPSRLPEIIVVTANDSVNIAVECIRRGASDFLVKPYDLDHIRTIVARSQRRWQLEARVLELQSQLDSIPSLGALLSISPSMHRVFDQIRKAASTSLPILIRGESGTGKELVARELHRLSPRNTGPFIAVNTAALSEHLIESELFGHVKGAFTGSDRNREGVFRKAHRGTLFLDEIGDMPVSVQTRLLRVLQEGVLTPVGSEEEIPVDVRVISATHQDLESAIEQKRFRADLYFRLRGIEIKLPPLRARSEDILLLANHFLQGELVFSPQATEAILRYAWPGNIRELKQRVEGAAAMARSSAIEPEDLGLAPPRPDSEVGSNTDWLAPYLEVPLTEGKQKLVEWFERVAIERALELEQGNVSAAARRLGIHRQSLQQKLKDLERA
ncbi:Nitrogen regulation protein NR(I) [Pirellula sp. SH-Sr6A]|nr:Nitrogen regulation protein NR(I) [Pirellula sp. SH-Sr6A]